MYLFLQEKCPPKVWCFRVLIEKQKEMTDFLHLSGYKGHLCVEPRQSLKYFEVLM